MTATPHPGKGIKEILNTAGVLTGWTTSLGKLVDTDKSIGIMDSSGRNPEPRLSLDYPSIQILVLGEQGEGGYLDAYAKAKAIKTALLGIPAGPADFPELTMCNQLGDINPLGYIDSGRPKFSLNFQLITEPDPAGYRESL